MFLTRKPEEIDMDEDRVKELHTQLVEFQRDQDAHLLEFPTTLSGRDRFLVHEVKLIFAHISGFHNFIYIFNT